MKDQPVTPEAPNTRADLDILQVQVRISSIDVNQVLQ